MHHYALPVTENIKMTVQYFNILSAMKHCMFFEYK